MGLFSAEPARVEGTVTRVVYRAAGGEFAVLRLRLDSGSIVTLAGSLAAVAQGERIRAWGTWSQHPSYGRQIAVEGYALTPPDSRQGLIAFLSGPRFAGVGKVMAARLVDSFGEAVLEKGKDEAALATVPGLSPKRARTLAEAFRAAEEEARLEVLLVSAGLGPKMMKRVKTALGREAGAEIRKDPYRLAEAVDGIGFRRADQVARELGISGDDPRRVRAAVLFALKEAEGEGHVYQELGEVAERVRTLGVAEPSAELLAEWVAAGDLTLEDGRLYLPALSRTESRVARLVASRLATPGRQAAAISLDGELTTDQAAAVREAICRPLSLLTGGPGTGKTTTLTGLVETVHQMGLRLELMAPSGRAARRLVEVTGHNARTLHRALRLRPYQGSRPETLMADVVVVDEASMLDLYLFSSLLEAVPAEATLFLVGDVDQLPPVGAGTPFGDLIRSGLVPTVRLTELYRQDPSGRLHQNARRILAGQFPEDGGADFVWHRQDDPERGLEMALQLSREESERFGQDDVVVLTAGNRGLLGAESLNERLQASLNPRQPKRLIGELRLGVGDKVLHRRNDYQKGVFNGEVGRVVEVGEHTVEVRYPAPEGEITVSYDRSDITDLSLGYALTVHKAQGSEFPVVIVVLSSQHYPLLRRNLFYTAVTRAKVRLHLVAGPKVVATAIRNDRDQVRRGHLVEKLAALTDGPTV